METLAIVVVAVALVGALLLVVSGIEHLRRLGRLRAVLVIHGVLPHRWHVARVLVLIELGVGSGVLVVTALLGVRRAGLWLLAESVVYASFAVYAGLFLRTRPGGGPCGCFSDDGAMSAAVMVRAGVVAAAAISALIIDVGEVSGRAPVLATSTIGRGLASRIDPSAFPRPAQF